MRQGDVETRLKAAYSDWRHRFNRDGIDCDVLSPPLLVTPIPPYCEAKTRVLVIGQETLGWRWDTDLQRKPWTYATPWPFAALKSFNDFLDNADSVEGLCWGYREFNFAEHQPANWRSPFWNAFRELQERSDTGVIWSNLCRVDYQGISFLNYSEPSRGRFIEQQGDILRTELEILNPHVSIFFTGPDYDHIIETVFSGIEFNQVNGYPARELALLSHASLPGRAFRTYHPGYLRRGNRADLFEALCQAAFSDA